MERFEPIGSLMVFPLTSRDRKNPTKDSDQLQKKRKEFKVDEIFQPKICVFLLAWLMFLFNPFGKKTHLVIQSDPFKGLSDLQLGDEKVTLNHLACRFLLSSKPFNEICANRPPLKFPEGHPRWDMDSELKFHTMKNDTPWNMIRSCTVCFLYDTNDS